MSIPGRRGYTYEEFSKAYWEKVNVRSEVECWPWMGTLRKDGYGKYKRKGRLFLAHRFAFEYAYGAILPSRVLVCHSCDNRKCCNPHHFFIGENDDNLKDAARKGLCCHGEDAWNAKLTEIAVKQIREKYLTNLYTHQDLDSEFGVSRRAVGFVVSGKNWRHVT